MHERGDENAAMKCRMMLRALVTATMFVSWFAISNHCALAGFSPPPRAGESCPMHLANM